MQKPEILQCLRACGEENNVRCPKVKIFGLFTLEGYVQKRQGGSYYSMDLFFDQHSIRQADTQWLALSKEDWVEPILAA